MDIPQLLKARQERRRNARGVPRASSSEVEALWPVVSRWSNRSYIVKRVTKRSLSTKIVLGT